MSGTENAPLLENYSTAPHNSAACNLNPSRSLIQKYGFNKQHSFTSFRVQLKSNLNSVGLL